jgi:membrane protease YdiL (CAAX protease family)
MSNEPVIPPRPDGLHPGPLEPGATWGWVEAVGIYLLALLAAGLATVPVFAAMGEDSDLAGLVATVVAALTIVGVLLLWLSKAHRGWQAVVRMPVHGRWRSDARAGALFGVGLYPVAVVVVGGILLVLLKALTGHSVKAPEQVPQDLSPVGLTLTILYAVAIAPFGEELFFRGVLFRAIRDRFGFRVGAAGSGVAFGVIHYIPGTAIDAALLMLVMTFVGAAFAFIYERRRSFTAPLAAHVTFNVIGLALILTFR